MKKKLEAELISIAHRILKLKNRAELDQLQQETLKLYEKLSVLKFVEDNFSEVKPTIGYASAEAKLEEIYSTPTSKEEVEDATIEKEEEVTTPEPETTIEEPKAAEKQEEPAAEVAPEEEAEVAETEEPKAEETEEVLAEEESEVAEPEQSEAEPETEEPVKEEIEEEAPVAEEEKAAQEVAQKEEKAEPAKEVQPAKIIVDAEVGLHPEEEVAITPEPEMPELGTLPETEGQDKDNTTGEGIDLPSGKPAVSEEEKEYTKGTDAGQTGFDFNFDKKLEDDFKPKQVSLEDFRNYQEPEFVKKDDKAKQAETPDPTLDDWRNWEPEKSTPAPDAAKAGEPKADEPKADATNAPLRDWRDWEPSKSTAAETPKQPEQPKAETLRDWRDWEPAKAPEPTAPATPEPPKPAPVAAPAVPVAPKFNDGFVRALSLGLNDRIAFEKNLFGGSSEDLNRVVSQLNTLNTFDEAKDFIADLVKPDYNNWAGKEEYEERFMQLVEKKFS